MFSTRNKARDIRVILFYTIYTFANDNLLRLLKGSGNDDAIFIFLSLFTIVEYLLFSYALYLNIRKPLFKKIIIYATPLFLAFSCYQFLNSSSNIDALTITLENLLLIIFCLFYFFDELGEPQATFIYSSYKFWMLVAILVYSTGTFFFFMQSDSLSNEQWAKWSIINYLCTTLKNILFSVAVLMRKDEPKDHDPWNTQESLFEKPFNTAL
jgi:hypothetical protein